MTQIKSLTSFKDTFLSSMSKLSHEDKEIFDRIYKVWETKGELVLPKEMNDWVEKKFGSVEAVTVQDFLKITNVITNEGSIFNDLRTRRPISVDMGLDDILTEIEMAKTESFSQPLTGTPADTFGRIKGKYCITASNIAKYDGLHGLIIFDNYNPLLFSRKRIRDYFDVSKKWFRKAYKSNPNAIYPMFTWNCLWKAGSTIIHGHAQLVLTEGQAYAKVEALRNDTRSYQEQYKSNYFDDIYNIHEKMGLGFTRKKIKVASSITPIKEKEIMIWSDSFNDDLADIVSDTLNTMKEKLGVMSFNLSIVLPPLIEVPESWDHFPILVRMLDRGKLTEKTADVGVMELYAQSIIGTSPYAVHDELKKALL